MSVQIITVLVALVAVCTRADDPSSSSSSSSSGASEDPTVSNLAAAAGACVGIVFLLVFYIFLERRYPNADVGFR
jgi:Ca2+/Na+ antiporter